MQDSCRGLTLHSKRVSATTLSQQPHQVGVQVSNWLCHSRDSPGTPTPSHFGICIRVVMSLRGSKGCVHPPLIKVISAKMQPPNLCIPNIPNQYHDTNIHKASHGPNQCATLRTPFPQPN
jgi:hypothetical protein